MNSVSRSLLLIILYIERKDIYEYLKKKFKPDRDKQTRENLFNLRTYGDKSCKSCIRLFNSRVEKVSGRLLEHSIKRKIFGFCNKSIKLGGSLTDTD